MTDRRAIQVGDLVQVVKVRDCCPERTAWGLIFRVAEITGTEGLWRCCYCDKIEGKQPAAWDSNGGGAELYRLKRIPPLEELEGTKTDEPIQEPA